jgi:hypothetical protein
MHLDEAMGSRSVLDVFRSQADVHLENTAQLHDQAGQFRRRNGTIMGCSQGCRLCQRAYC